MRFTNLTHEERKFSLYFFDRDVRLMESSRFTHSRSECIGDSVRQIIGLLYFTNSLVKMIVLIIAIRNAHLTVN